MKPIISKYASDRRHYYYDRQYKGPPIDEHPTLQRNLSLVVIGVCILAVWWALGWPL